MPAPQIVRTPAGAETPAADAAAGTTKVGLLLPLSGPQAQLGQSLYKAAELALFDVADESFSLVVRDTGGTPETAARAAQEAIDEGAQLLLGPVFSSSMVSVAPVARRAGVSMVGFSTDRNAANVGSYVMGILPHLQVQRVVNYAARQKIRSIGALVPSDAYGNAIVQALQDSASRAGITMGQVVYYDPNAADKSVFAKQLIGAGYDAVLIPEGGNNLRMIAPSFANAKVQLLGSTQWDDPALASEPGLNGGWFAAPPPDLRRDFESKYQSVHGEAPPRLATIVYDAVALAATLSAKGQPFTADALTNPDGFKGLDGIFRFNRGGTVERGLAVMEMRNGRAVVRDPAPEDFNMVVF